MAVLQVFQAKMLQALDERGSDSESFRKLHSATDLALRVTKKTAQGIGRSMSSLAVLQRHLWLTLTDMRDSEKARLMDAPISPNSLFGDAVGSFSEKLLEVQKQSLSAETGCISSTEFQIFLSTALVSEARQAVCCIFFGHEEGLGACREAQVQVLQAAEEAGTPSIETYN